MKKSDSEDKSYLWEPMDFTMPNVPQTWTSFYEDLLKRMKENALSEYDREMKIKKEVRP